MIDGCDGNAGGIERVVCRGEALAIPHFERQMKQSDGVARCAGRCRAQRLQRQIVMQRAAGEKRELAADALRKAESEELRVESDRALEISHFEMRVAKRHSEIVHASTTALRSPVRAGNIMRPRRPFASAMRDSAARPS